MNLRSCRPGRALHGDQAGRRPETQKPPPRPGAGTEGVLPLPLPSPRAAGRYCTSRWASEANSPRGASFRYSCARVEARVLSRRASAMKRA